MLRGEALRLREQEFVEAARAQGASGPRIMFSEIFPNIITTVLVFFPLLVANAVLRGRRCRSSARACAIPTRRGAR